MRASDHKDAPYGRGITLTHFDGTTNVIIVPMDDYDGYVNWMTALCAAVSEQHGGSFCAWRVRKKCKHAKSAGYSRRQPHD